MLEYAPEDVRLSNALFRGHRIEAYAPDVLIPALARMVVGQAVAIKFLAEQVDELHKSSGT